MKILINTPPLDLLDGIAGHFKGLKDYWSLNIQYNTLYKTQKNKYGHFFLPFNIVKFIQKLVFFNPSADMSFLQGKTPPISPKG